MIDMGFNFRRLMLLLATFSLIFATASADEPVPLAIGDPMPSFDLPAVDGKNHTDAEYRDAKALLILFTCNHCPTAQAYEDRIEKLEAEYRQRGVRLVAISPNDDQAVRLDELGYSDLGDSLEDMKLRAEDANFEFPYLYDGETQSVSRAFGAKATPHAFLFDADRKLRYAGRIDDGEVGKVTKRDLRDAMEAVLSGREVSVPTTRVFGCSVKWAAKRASAAESIKKWEQEPVELSLIGKEGIAKLVAGDSENYRLINLWATWCGPCVTELPLLVDVNRMYRRRHFQLITISMDDPESKEDALKILKETHASTTNFISELTDTDEFAEVFDEKWPGPLPYTILVSPEGEIVYRKEGEIDLRSLRREIADRLGRTYASRK
jgi:peroxiredoxin